MVRGAPKRTRSVERSGVPRKKRRVRERREVWGCLDCCVSLGYDLDFERTVGRYSLEVGG